VRTETDAVILMFKPRGAEDNGSRSVEQRVPLVWTRCHFGGARPWFRCVAYVGGRPAEGAWRSCTCARPRYSRAAGAVD
jgi:hypothetical protein